MDNWIPTKKELPKKDGSYLTTVKHSNKFSSIMILGFVKDLYKFNKYEFEEYKGKKKSGWYNHDPEFGVYEVHGVTAWMNCPEKYEEVN